VIFIERHDDLPETVRELLLAPKTHQRALIDQGVIGCVFLDPAHVEGIADGHGGTRACADLGHRRMG
jgi:hypothetical protein